MCLKPGLVLLNNTRVNEKNCPLFFINGIKFGLKMLPASTEELEFQKKVGSVSLKLKDLGFETKLEEFHRHGRNEYPIFRSG